MKVLKKILIVVLFFSGCALYSQELPNEKWYKGEVTLRGGATKTGLIKYDLKANSIQYSTDGTIQTFHATQFYTFTILLVEQRLRRDFYVLPYEGNTGFARPTIFELLTEGAYSLLAREYMARTIKGAGASYGYGLETIPEPDHQLSRATPTVKYLDYNLFLADSDGNVTPLKAKKSDVIDRFGKHKDKIKHYIKQQRLNVKDLVDLVKVVEYYNELENL